jgi:hypothetical protein
MQVFGGYGYIKEYKVEQLVRDARIACVYEGTNGIQAIDLLFRKVARDQGAGLKELLGEIGAFAAQAKTLAKGALVRELAELGKRTMEVGEVAQKLGQTLGKNDMAAVALGATPFLLLLGNLVGGWLLLQQAAIAEEALAGMGAPAEGEARSAWARDDEERAFYAAKVETAKFYVHQLLPENAWRAAQATAQDRSALLATI